MRLLPRSACFVIACASSLLFGIASLIASSTYSPDTLEWTRQCALTAREGRAVMTCGDYEDKYLDKDQIVAVIADSSIATSCRGFLTRGLKPIIRAECGPTK